MSTPRERLLDTAARLFTERGYECVGINEIIASAEVAKASFYQHFPSKKDLCAAWLREEAAAVRSTHEEILATPGSLRRKLTGLFDDLTCLVSGNCFRGCPFSVTAAMTEAGEESQEIIREYTEDCRAFWQALARKTGLSPARARVLGDHLFLLYTGAFTQAQNSGDSWPVEQARKAALALVRAATSSP